MRSGGLTTRTLALTLVAVATLEMTSAWAQTTGATLTPLQVAIACAPPLSTAAATGDVIRVIGAQGVDARALFDPRDLLVVSGGTARGVALGQEYFLRRVQTHGGVYSDRARALRTSAWIKIIAVNDSTAIASVESACGPILAGDYLEPFVAPQPPPGADRVDTSGQLDFSSPALVLYGNEEHRNAVVGDFVLIDRGAEQGVAPGARYAFYRDPGVPNAPLTPLGEGVVVATGPSTSLLRVNESRAEVQSGDFAVSRK